jgi:hypothetical protein
MPSSNESQRYELYVGVFLNHLWSSDSLCAYFHRLIEGSYITQCRLHSCDHLIHNSLFSFLIFCIIKMFIHTDYSFAILTFDSISSIDQCMSKRVEIKKEHRFVVQRNLRNVSKTQKRVCHYILIHLDRFGLYLFE